jgi:site-specific recombinase XerD
MNQILQNFSFAHCEELVHDGDKKPARGKNTMDIPNQLIITLTRFINSLSGRNLSDHTATAYHSDVRQFLTWLAETDLTVTAPLHITRGHILAYQSYLASLGRSGVTRARKLASIRKFCKFLVDEKSLPASPAEHISMPKKERKQRVFLRVDEYMRLLNAAAGNSRDYAILQLFLQTGIRVAELVGLTLTDTDLDGQSMLINGKGNKQRTVYLEKKATQAIKSYLKDRPRSGDVHVFLNYQGNGLSVQGVMDIVEKYRKAAGITKQFSCHSLRHTCATYKASRGYTPAELQDLLGHEKPETSFIYVHMARDAKKLMQTTSL